MEGGTSMLGDKEIADIAGEAAAPWWHALYTRHQHEKVVAQALTGKGFDVFLPQYRAVHRWKDRQKELQLPLFPNYVFIRGGLDRMLNIVTTPGVHTVVSWGGKPANIPTEEIEAVRRLVESPLKVEPYPFLKTGDWVRIKSGPLEGIEGILVRKTRGYRLVLSVEMLSKSAAVEVDASMVENLRPAQHPRGGKQLAAADAAVPAANRPYVIGTL
jgi:transcription antitermination factor NusG